MSLVEKIKNLANENGITIAELERRTSISNGQIRKWDITTPGIDKLEAIANYFNVSVDYLLGRETPKKSLTVEEALKSTMGFDGKEIDESDREILAEIIKAYLKKK
ncbi:MULTISPECIES: helix-turn-helix transcriptional regulator [unclassified Enterococcus]|uniref:helix-turn-helix domain-containing protein n=1 Tax=unclassified Enterococcus TaxID=2608891 RepID=UPI0015583208|nr:MULTISPECIES: helix-turn-helix transcriptional regulator [unclassified Enterococcus]MBS7577484.1 helix-turn-helix transcriptional regulator [Enterococcus sp. MMGLQ5-2]MBS7585017.1 helix-turn-helix transcriptional regulator [Enterococcus sp. MMGLQ5-1]NPD12873.1 helix-turn-helix transcriptional regulator [Enterococcus sp. MMGLQ5-1]NPD37316.1 helix-turn-helix transcriptional regulator [Enterococcus sp. MMGLQ5-2]